MYHRLTLLHPLAYIEKYPVADFATDADGKTVWRPSTREENVDKWEHYVYGELIAYAFRVMNLHWTHDAEETRASLRRDLERHARAAARRAGFQFVDRTSNDRRTLDGEPSLRWLRRMVPKVADLVVEEWDPNEHARVLEWARRGGKASKRRPKHAPSELPPGTIAQQAAALGVSTSTIARMRRAAYHGVEPLPKPQKFFNLYPASTRS